MTNNNNKQSAINYVFIFLILSSIFFAAYQSKNSQHSKISPIEAITQSSFESAKSAVSLSISLVGVMALWLGFMKILEAGGMMNTLAKLLRPILIKLFPDVPQNHPAMGAMILNISANMLGLGNAATPFGIKAMEQLQKLNKFKDTATNAMCLFLALNTSSLALLPLGVIGIRAAAGAKDPTAIFLPSLIATSISTVVALISCKILSNRTKLESQNQKKENEEDITEIDNNIIANNSSILSKFISYLIPVSFLILIFRMGFSKDGFNSRTFITFFKTDFQSHWLIPFLMLLIISYGINKGVKIYEAVTEGAKQGFDIAVRIIPFLVSILVAIGMFKASGAMELISSLLKDSFLTSTIGMPIEAIPMAIIRPLSGSGAFAIMSAVVNADPDSYSSFVVSVMMGSTETTFYVLAIYFGSVGITKVRYALTAALLADFAGIISSCILSKMFY